MGPDLQLSFAPGSFAADVFGVLEKEPGMTIAVCPVRPESRGSIMDVSPDPAQPAAIRPHYLSAPGALDVLRSDKSPVRTAGVSTYISLGSPSNLKKKNQ